MARNFALRVIKLLPIREIDSANTAGYLRYNRLAALVHSYQKDCHTYLQRWKPGTSIILEGALLS